MLFGGSKKRPQPGRPLPPGMRPAPPRPGGQPPRPGVPQKPGGTTASSTIGGGKYAPKVAVPRPRIKQKLTGNFVFRSVFFAGFLLTVYVLGPNYKIRGAAISFGLIGLMLIGVILIDAVMWKCPACGRYLGFLPWPGKRCKKCFVKLF